MFTLDNFDFRRTHLLSLSLTFFLFCSLLVCTQTTTSAGGQSKQNKVISRRQEGCTATTHFKNKQTRTENMKRLDTSCDFQTAGVPHRKRCGGHLSQSINQDKRLQITSLRTASTITRFCHRSDFANYSHPLSVPSYLL